MWAEEDYSLNKLGQGIKFAGIIWGKIEYSLENLGEVSIY